MTRREVRDSHLLSLGAGKVFVLAVILVAAAVGAVFNFPGPQLGGHESRTTVTSTTATSCTSALSSGTSTTTSSVTPAASTSGSPTVLNGTFASSSNTSVRVDSIQALIFPGAPGSEGLTFRISFTNVGSSAIYVVAGCGSSLNSTMTSGADVVETVNGGARCLCAEYMAPVDPGQGHTSTDPGCWSGYSYVVRGPGQFSVFLDLYWADSPSGSAAGHLRMTGSFNIS